jgi:outer membrane lipoprotein carrier protein
MEFAMKMKNFFLPGLAVLFLLSSVPALAVTSATERLNNFVKTVTTFQAKFSQTVLDPQGQLMEKAEGLFILERPGKFRWNYKQPYPQTIVADGKNIWFYDVDLEQVSVKSQQEALANTPASLLSGGSLPQDSYSIKDLPSQDGLAWVELTPKDTESNFQTVTLAFDDHSLSQMIMKDSFDQQTRLVFTQTVENPIMPEGMFNFIAPEGVDIVGDIAQ